MTPTAQHITGERREAGSQLAQTLNSWNSGDPAQGVSAAELRDDTLSVLGEGGEERLTLSSKTQPGGGAKHFITGRGGRYPLGLRTTAAIIAGAVSRLTAPAPHHALSAAAQAAGFDFVQVGAPMRFKYECWLTLYHARHPDGRVVWFEECDHHAYHGELVIHTLDSGVRGLGGVYIPSDEEGLILRADDFWDALDAGGTQGPDVMWSYAWTVQERAAAALLADPAQSGPLPGGRPDRFFLDPGHTPGVERRDIFPDYLRGHAARTAMGRRLLAPELAGRRGVAGGGADHTDLPF